MQEGPGEDIYIRLSLPYDRAWASVGRAMRSRTFEITDRDAAPAKYASSAPDSARKPAGSTGCWAVTSDPMANQVFIVSVESLDARRMSPSG